MALFLHLMSWRFPLSWGSHPSQAPAGLWRQPFFLPRGCWLPGPQVGREPCGCLMASSGLEVSPETLS